MNTAVTSTTPFNVFTLGVPKKDIALFQAMVGRMGWSVLVDPVSTQDEESTLEAEPVITAADLTIAPEIAQLFQNIPPLPADFDERKAYGEYLYEKYR